MTLRKEKKNVLFIEVLRLYIPVEYTVHQSEQALSITGWDPAPPTSLKIFILWIGSMKKCKDVPVKSVNFMS